ncbi:MAG: AMP-dependent synthetase and ligase [Myxococcaceae bacterium]|nr:AMP-dependent synthetase and ligase [Myxococcaceae bacterium]
MTPASTDTLVSLFQRQTVGGKNRPALRTKRAGNWVAVTWGEWGQRSRAIAAELIASGVAPGDRVAIFGNTREEWVFADVAILLAGAITIPIYQTLIGEQAAYVVEDSGAKVLFAENVAFVQRIAEAAPKVIDRLAKIVVFDGPLDGLPETIARKTITLGALLADGTARAQLAAQDLDARAAAVKPSHLATIVYTSGTTGPPKGVMLTHENFVFETGAVLHGIEIGPTDEQILFLPMAHIFAKVLIALQLRVGFVTAFAESITKVFDNAVEINPTFMGSVPRLYEKIFAVANDKASKEPPAKQKIFAWAIGVGRQVAKKKEQGAAISPILRAQHAVADKLVLSKIRHRFGTKLKFAISGGAPLAKELAEWFFGVGIVVLEGYGLTETTAATNINLPDAYRFGTVGKVFPGDEVKIAADGEILMRGPNIMKGYWKKEADTNEVLEPDGWFHSGDIGEFDADGFLRITDRKKDIIVTAGGKNVAPQNIENLLKQSPWISQAMVHGDKRPYLVALITLNADAATAYAKDSGKPFDLVALATDPGVVAKVEEEIKRANGRLSPFETVKKFKILPAVFTIEGGELTPTLKVKRKVVTERHRGLIDGLYNV